MANNHKIIHSIICEHTRQLAAHDKARPDLREDRRQQTVSSESRLEEVNRGRRMLLFNALGRRRVVKALPDGSKS